MNTMRWAVCLLFLGCLAAASSGCGASRLVYAAESGNLQDVRDLVDGGVDVDATEFGRTALLFAAQEGHIDVVEFLLERGANVNHRKKGITALLLAAERGFPDVIKVLLEADADPTIGMEGYGNMPVHQACWSGHISAVKALAEVGDGLESRNLRSMTPLHMATLYDHPGLVSRLVDLGADVNARNSDGWTALHYACSIWSPETVSILASHGIDATLTTNDGQTALHLAAIAASCGHRHVPTGDRRNTVKRGAPATEVNSGQVVRRGKYGSTAGDPVGTGSPYADMRRILVRAGCDPTTMDREGRTADQIHADHGQAALLMSSWGGSRGTIQYNQHILQLSLQNYLRYTRSGH